MIETDNFDVLDRKFQVDKLIVNRKWEKAEKAVDELEKELDLSLGCNRQYVKEMRYIIGRMLSRIDKEELFPMLKNILAVTIENIPKEIDILQWSKNFWNRSFTTGEVSVMIQMADALKDMNLIEQAVFLMEKLMACYQRSCVRPEFHFRTVILIVARLSSYYGALAEYEKALQYAEEGIRLSLVSGTRALLPHFVNNKGAVSECMGNKKAGLYYYKQAFYSAELLEKKSDDYKSYYEKLAGGRKEWY